MRHPEPLIPAAPGWRTDVDSADMRPVSVVMCLLLLFGMMTAGPRAQGHAMPSVAPDSLSRPIGRQDGIGVARDVEATLSADVRPLYEQGLALLHNYVWLDASRSFNQVLRMAPNNALAHIGLSYAYDALNLRSMAREQMRAAVASATTPHERVHARLRQLEMQAEDAPAEQSLHRAYRTELDRALQAFATDAELWLLRGMAEAAVPGDRGQGSRTASIAYYEHARKLAPDTLAPHHYLAHAYENSGDWRRALESASRYAAQAPAVPHAHHMVGHDLRRAGRIDDAIAEFERADALQRTYFAREGVAAEADWHYEHNLDLLGTSYQYTGQLAHASRLLASAFALPSANLVQIVNKRQWPLLLRLAGRQDDALTAARWFTSHPNSVARAIGHIENAHVLLMRSESAKAAIDANAALTLLRTRPPGGGLADVPLRLLQGEFFLRQGEHQRGAAMLLAAVGDARAGQGPDEWVQALFMMEWTATVARETGAWDLAAAVARQMLDHDAAYGGSHYAMALVEAHGARPDAALAEFRQARRLWANADPDFGPRRVIDAALAERH